MAKEKIDVTTLDELGQAVDNSEWKMYSKELARIEKLHLRGKNLLRETHGELALLKAILKHEKKTMTRPEEVYFSNLKKTIERNIQTLRVIYPV